jgi:hypothetical protein
MLMDCMAAMPSAGGSRPSAFITKAEKAKKTPAINPQPSAVKSVKAKRGLSTVAIYTRFGLICNVIRAFLSEAIPTGVAFEIKRLPRLRLTESRKAGQKSLGMTAILTLNL